jgi:hypothetical protein
MSSRTHSDTLSDQVSLMARRTAGGQLGTSCEGPLYDNASQVPYFFQHTTGAVLVSLCADKVYLVVAWRSGRVVGGRWLLCICISPNGQEQLLLLALLGFLCYVLYDRPLVSGADTLLLR